MTKVWHPNWWNEDVHATGWARVREAMKRDWEQTKKDLHVGGHEMNQSASDTMRQATGQERIPPFDRANPPKVIGDFDAVEAPMSYGYVARSRYGKRYPRWSDELESTLRADWEGASHAPPSPWNDARRWVRHGYEYTPLQPGMTASGDAHRA